MSVINGATTTSLYTNATVPDMGWLSIFVDPTGAMLGLWESMFDPKRQWYDYD
jgi:predicted enzyme related to lactoylglutathione lyase